MLYFDYQNEENIEPEPTSSFMYYIWVISIVVFILIIYVSYFFTKRYILCKEKHFDQCSLQKFLYNPRNDSDSRLDYKSYEYNVGPGGQLVRKKKNNFF